MVLGNVLVLSREHPRRMVYTIAVAATINIGMNLLLIPPYKEIGAASAMLTSMVVYAIMANWIALLDIGRIQWISTLAAPLGASVAMTVPLILLGGSFALALLVGVPLYAATYAVIESRVAPDDLRFVIDLFKKRLPGRARRAEAAEAA